MNQGILLKNLIRLDNTLRKKSLRIIWKTGKNFVKVIWLKANDGAPLGK